MAGKYKGILEAAAQSCIHSCAWRSTVPPPAQ